MANLHDGANYSPEKAQSQEELTIDKDGRVAEAMAVPKDFSGRESRNIDDPKLRRAVVKFHM